MAFFSKKNKKELTFKRGLNGAPFSFTQLGNLNYSDETIQACISRIAVEMKKLRARHVKLDTVNGGYKSIDDRINYILKNPNERQTSADFLEYVTWQLFLNYNAFIIPYYDDRGGLISLYPLPQGAYSILTDNNGTDYLKCQFNGLYDDMTFIYKNVIHLRLKYSVNEVMGGNQEGQPDNIQLQQLEKLNAQILVNVAKNVKGSIKGYFTPKTYLDKDSLIASRKALQELWEGDNSFALLDAGTEYKELSQHGANVDAETLKFLDKKILRYYGVSEAILSGDYNTSQKTAFYQSVLEPLAISWGQAFTKALFTEREKQVGNAVMFFTDEFDYMTIAEKMELVRLLGDQGGLYLNEVRRMFGLEPIADMDGRRLQSLNYTEVEKNLKE